MPYLLDQTHSRLLMIRHRVLSPAFRRVVCRCPPASSPLGAATTASSPGSLSFFSFPAAAARMASTLPRLPIFGAIAQHDPGSPAVLHSASGRSFAYGQLLGDVARARDRLREARGGADLDGERIAFIVENSYDYVGKQARRSPALFGPCVLHHLDAPRRVPIR